MYIQTAETVESIVTQLMEKQRCARAAALSGKSLDCPSCGDPNQECNLHHVTGTTVQSTTGGGGSGRRVQATKSEAHTTTSGRSSGHNRSTHKRMLQHRIHENNNQVCTVFPVFFSFSFFPKWKHTMPFFSFFDSNLWRNSIFDLCSFTRPTIDTILRVLTLKYLQQLEIITFKSINSNITYSNNNIEWTIQDIILRIR